jgi:hypothetical protein
MRKLSWIRLGLASAVITAAGTSGLAVGCSGDDTNATPDAGHDSGHPPVDSGGLVDSGNPVDGNKPDTNMPPPVPHAKIILANASPDPDLQALRFCFGIDSGAGAQVNSLLPPLPDTLTPPFPIPGLFAGFAGPLPNSINLETVGVKGFVILASKIANINKDAGTSETKCDALVGADGTGGMLTANQDYFALPEIPAMTLKDQTTWLIAITGCLPAAAPRPPAGDGGPSYFTADIAHCGGTFMDATGNFGSALVQLDTTTAQDGGSFGAQVVDLSSAWEGVAAELAQLGGAPPGTTASQTVLFANETTGPLGAPVAVGLTYPNAQPAMAAALPGTILADPVHNVLDTETVGALPMDAGNLPNSLISAPIPLGGIVQLTTGNTMAQAADGGLYFAPGENYTFVLLGDPSSPSQLTIPTIVNDAAVPMPNPNFDGTGLHVIAFPNHLAVPASF